jgi:hypothetical protein
MSQNSALSVPGFPVTEGVTVDSLCPSKGLVFGVREELPDPRINPNEHSSRQGVPQGQPPIRPWKRYTLAGEIEASLGPSHPGVKSTDVQTRFPESPNASIYLGPSLLRSHLLRQEFPYMPIQFVSWREVTDGWSVWVRHTFSQDLEFVEILTRTGVAHAIRASLACQSPGLQKTLICSWSAGAPRPTPLLHPGGEFTPTLEDVAILLKLPVFGGIPIFFPCDYLSLQ